MMTVLLIAVLLGAMYLASKGPPPSGGAVAPIYPHY